MATVNIGNIKFTWKGAYNASTAYVIDDVVSYNGSSYVCIQATTGNLPTVTAYWEQMSQKGTDADLINITGTVQGDIYYNNGSAIARLGAGTSGQALLTQGTGANPQWGDVSSGELQYLSTHTLTSDTSVWNLDNIFDNTNYDHHVINLYNLSHNNSTVTDTWLGLRVSSSLKNVNIYLARIRVNSSGAGFSNGTMTDGYQRIEHSGAKGNSAFDSSNYKIHIYNTSGKKSDGTASTHQPQTIIQYNSPFSHTDAINAGFSFGRWNTTDAVDGIALQRSGYNIIGSVTKPKVDVFGVIKQS